MTILGVIPARYGSTRLEGKPLKDICGKPMIQHVFEAVKRAALLDETIVATDDTRIVQAVQAFGGLAQLTSVDHRTGTDRIAEVAARRQAEIVVNIQGDEPLIDPRMIDETIQPLLDDPELPASTLCRPILNSKDLHSPHVVKAVFDRRGHALYFSRSLIPYPRKNDSHQAFEHIGIYAYRIDFLMKYITLESTPLELTESLEQLRILEHGYRLKVAVTQYEYSGLSVDTAEDLEEVRRIISAREKPVL